MVSTDFKWILSLFLSCESVRHDLMNLKTLDSLELVELTMYLYFMCCDAFISIHHTIDRDNMRNYRITILRMKVRNITFILDHDLGGKLMSYWDWEIDIWTLSTQ